MSSSALNTIASIVGTARRYLPEPASRGVGLFQDILGGVSKAFGGGDVGGVPLQATGDFASLIQMQIDAQKEMQSVTLVSNLEKSNHESKMSAIRNVRVS